jgi:hypothetical protein
LRRIRTNPKLLQGGEFALEEERVHHHSPCSLFYAHTPGRGSDWQDLVSHLEQTGSPLRLPLPPPTDVAVVTGALLDWGPLSDKVGATKDPGFVVFPIGGSRRR